jgi:hypothetical protein
LVSPSPLLVEEALLERQAQPCQSLLGYQCRALRFIPLSPAMALSMSTLCVFGLVLRSPVAPLSARALRIVHLILILLLPVR